MSNKTHHDLTPRRYRLLKKEIAAKLSARSAGQLTYLLLASEPRSEDEPSALYLAVTGNEGGGLWSREAVALDAVEQVLDAIGSDRAFPTNTLKAAIVGRSTNNAPFLCAVLRALGLLRPAPDAACRHLKAGDWQDFRSRWLSQPGEAVIYPPPTVSAGQSKKEAEDTGSTVPAVDPRVRTRPPLKDKKGDRGQRPALPPDVLPGSEPARLRAEEVAFAETEHAPTQDV